MLGWFAVVSSRLGSAEGRHAESDEGWGAGAAVDLGELVLGAGEADLESFGFAEPAFAVGFGDAGGEVVADLGDSVISWRWTESCLAGAAVPSRIPRSVPDEEFNEIFAALHSHRDRALVAF
jgi:hypothetical protein